MIAVHGPSLRASGCGWVHVAVGLARLGVPVALIGSGPDDPKVLEHLEAEGVERRPSRRLPAAIAAIHACLPQPARSTEGAEELEELLRREHDRTLVSLDPSVGEGATRDRDASLRRLEGWLGMVSLVRMSRTDLAWLVPGEPPETVAERWAASDTTLVVLTLGADGAYAIGRRGSARSGAHAVNVVDTMGAGDAFTAGILAWLHRRRLCEAQAVGYLSDEDLAEALDFASRVAALACARAGAAPPTLAEVEAGP